MCKGTDVCKWVTFVTKELIDAYVEKLQGDSHAQRALRVCSAVCGAGVYCCLAQALSRDEERELRLEPETASDLQVENRRI